MPVYDVEEIRDYVSQFEFFGMVDPKEIVTSLQEMFELIAEVPGVKSVGVIENQGYYVLTVAAEIGKRDEVATLRAFMDIDLLGETSGVEMYFDYCEDDDQAWMADEDGQAALRLTGKERRDLRAAWIYAGPSMIDPFSHDFVEDEEAARYAMELLSDNQFDGVKCRFEEVGGRTRCSVIDAYGQLLDTTAAANIAEFQNSEVYSRLAHRLRYPTEQFTASATDTAVHLSNGGSSISDGY